MGIIIILLLGVLGTPIFDLYHSKALSLSGSLIYWQETREFRQKKKKRKQKLYAKGKWKRRASFKTTFLSLKGTRPKDPRFSNQRKLRRMFRNA